MLALSEALPCSKRADFLRNQMGKKLLESLDHLLDVSSEVVTTSTYEDTSAKLILLKNVQKFPSFLFALNAELIEAIEKEDLPQIEVLFNLFSKLPIDSSFRYIRGDQLEKKFFEIFVKQVSFDRKGEENIRYSSLEFFESSSQNFQEASKRLAILAPEYGREANEFINSMLFFNSDIMKGGSSFSLFGMCYVSELIELKDNLDYVDFIIHETAHHHIFALSAIDPLVLNLPSERYTSPFRKDPRPLIGIYHATFVLGRLINAFQQILGQSNISGLEAESCIRRLKEYKEKFLTSYELLFKHAQFSELGNQVLQSAKGITIFNHTFKT